MPAQQPPLPLPSVLENRTWWAIPNHAGTLDGRARTRLPSEERPLAASDGRVASVQFGDDSGVGPIPATLRVRDIATGRSIAAVDWPQGIDLQVALGSAALYFVGYQSATSGALYALSYDDGSISPVIEPDGARRGGPVLSLSGRFLGLVSCLGSCSAEIVDLESHAVSRFPVEGVPFLVSDTQLFTFDNSEVYAYGLASGQIEWVLMDVLVQRGYLSSDGATLVAQTGFDPSATSPHGSPLSEEATRPGVVVINAATGKARLVHSWDLAGAPSLWTAVSGDQVAVLVDDAREGIPLMGKGRLSLTLLDLASGDITPNAVLLDP